MTNKQAANPTPIFTGDVSPDSLMGDFRGRPIFAIVVFTVIVHVIVVGVFSMGYLKNQLLGADISALSDQERMDSAVREGTTALREIAERYDVSVQDLSSRFSGSRKSAAAPVTNANESREAGASDRSAAPDEPKSPDSDIEKTLQRKEVGPAVPNLSPDEEDDLFAP